MLPRPTAARTLRGFDALHDDWFGKPAARVLLETQDSAFAAGPVTVTVTVATNLTLNLIYNLLFMAKCIGFSTSGTKAILHGFLIKLWSRATDEITRLNHQRHSFFDLTSQAKLKTAQLR
jgi:hypothetical protein